MGTEEEPDLNRLYRGPAVPLPKWQQINYTGQRPKPKYPPAPEPRSYSRYVLSVRCPKCKATPGNPCKYVKGQNLSHIDLRREHLYSPDQVRKRKQVGLPTDRPHNERYAKAKKQAEEDYAAAQRRLHKPIVYRAKAAREAYAAALHRENAELTEWLRQYGHLLIGLGDSGKTRSSK